MFTRPERLVAATLISVLLGAAVPSEASSFHFSYTGEELFQNIQSGAASNPSGKSLSTSNGRLIVNPSAPANGIFYLHDLPVPLTYATGPITITAELLLDEPTTVDSDTYVLLLAGNSAVGFNALDASNNPLSGGLYEAPGVLPDRSGLQGASQSTESIDAGAHHRLTWSWTGASVDPPTLTQLVDGAATVTFSANVAFQPYAPIQFALIQNQAAETQQVLALNLTGSYSGSLLVPRPEVPSCAGPSVEPTLLFEEAGTSKIQFGVPEDAFLCADKGDEAREPTIVVPSLFSEGNVNVQGQLNVNGVDVEVALRQVLDRLAALEA